MTKADKAKRIWLTAAVVLLVVGLGCSTKSPTAPTQTPAPPAGTDVSALWEITVNISPDEIARESAEPARVSVRVRKVSDGTPPPQGTTIVVSTSLGEFVSLGSGLTSVALGTTNGRAETLFFPGPVEGTAVVSAQLESSAGQAGVAIREGVVAAFTTANQVDNLSIQFISLSTGDPTRFFWDFGDGAKSREENPAHQFAHPGDYAVSLRVERGTFSDRAIQAVLVKEPLFITDVAPNKGTIGSSVQLRGQGFIKPLRVRFGPFTADVPFISSGRDRLTTIVPHIPIDSFGTEECVVVDEMGTEIIGAKPAGTFFDITVETGDGTLSDSDTLVQAYKVFPPNDDCDITSGSGGTGGGALSAFFTESCTGLTCTFTDASTGGVIGWFYDFDDSGATSVAPSPIHSFSSAGSYSVSLTVTGTGGVTDTFTKVISVS